MATWFVGDVHGQLPALLALIDRCSINPSTDTVVCVGDLVNRGPNSAGVLRWVRDNAGWVSTVLGNHDAFAIAASMGFALLRKKDDALRGLLVQPDADDLIISLSRSRRTEWEWCTPAFHPGGRGPR